MSSEITLALLVLSLSCLATAPAAAHVVIDSDLRGPVPLGTTHKLATLELLNEDPQGPDMTVCNAGECGSQGITLIPSCAAQGPSGECTAPDPDVFSIGSTAVGAANTHCAGMSFTVTKLLDGTYSFNPTAGQHIVLPPIYRCLIEFTYDVLKAATTDSRPDLEGLQTSQVSEVYSTESLPALTPAFDRGSDIVEFDIPSPPRPATPSRPVTPAPVADTAAPTLSAVSLSPTTFRAAASGDAIASDSVGTRVRYRLSEAAKVRFRVERARSGRRVRGRCDRPRRDNRGARPCVRYVSVRGNFTHAGQAGRNSFRFSGRVGGRRLVRGSYRLRAVASDAAGNASRPLSKRFRIVRR